METQIKSTIPFIIYPKKIKILRYKSKKTWTGCVCWKIKGIRIGKII